MLKNKKTLIAIVLLPFVFYGLAMLYENQKVNDIYAVDPIYVSYNGDIPPDPMFDITNFLPGDETEKEFKVKNESPESLSVELTADKTSENKNFSHVLNIEITDLTTSGVIFTGKLKDLFNSPPIQLGNFSSSETKTYKAKVNFPINSGNEYQNASVVFNIIWRTNLPIVELPPECKHLKNIITNVIEGTENKDNIHGTHASELIITYGGNDKVDAGAGHDCIVSGNGNNKIDGGAGNDVIITGNGNNKIKGGSGNDTIYSGIGNDTIDGDSGDDIVYSGGGNDKINGSSGNDYLDGQAGFDNLNGNTGTDTCVNGEILSNCEI